MLPVPGANRSPPWKRLYKTAQWQRLRQSTFLRDRYTCQMCRCIEGNTSRLICDHKQPHRGDERLFFDPTNLWTLCKPCHDTVKQQEEQDSVHQRGVWY